MLLIILIRLFEAVELLETEFRVLLLLILETPLVDELFVLLTLLLDRYELGDVDPMTGVLSNRDANRLNTLLLEIGEVFPLIFEGEVDLGNKLDEPKRSAN